MILFAALATSMVNAQEITDTVKTSGNTMDVYYNLHTGEKFTADRDNWDIAFESKGFTASVLINGQKGIMLYSSPYEVKDWASFDTTGYAAWPTTQNSRESWSKGAFNHNLSSEFDLGWGTYNVSNHVITGDSVFLVELEDGSMRKLYVNELASGVYKFTYANVDGSNEKTVELKKNDIGAQNFGFYSLKDEMFMVREPDTEEWDVVFTEYISPIPTGPGQFVDYPVTGVKINKNVQVAQRDGMDVTSDDTSNLNWSTNMTEIGSDWKSWNGTAYEYEEDRAYFVKLDGGQMWKMYFTKYEGGPLGNFYFVKEKMASGVGIETIAASRVNVYPNPVNQGSAINISLDDNTQLVEVRVYNQAMQLVSVQESASIATNDLVTGLYFMAVETTEGSAVKQLIIK